MGCSVHPAGRIVRYRENYDIAPCSACGSFVNTHTNAACLIRDKSLLSISPFSPPSLSALPAIIPSSFSRE